MYYVVATRSTDWIARAIILFSELAGAKHEYSHVVLVKGNPDLGGTNDKDAPIQRHQTMPLAKEEPFRYWQRPNHVYKIDNDNVGELAWQRAGKIIEEKSNYGVLQLVSMVWSIITLRKPIDDGRVCSEFIAECIYGENARWMNVSTVGQVIDRLQADKRISFVKEASE